MRPSTAATPPETSRDEHGTERHNRRSCCRTSRSSAARATSSRSPPATCATTSARARLAEAATDARVAEAAAPGRDARRHEAQSEEQAHDMAHTLNRTVLTIKERAGIGGQAVRLGHLSDIADAIWKARKIRIDRRKVRAGRADQDARQPPASRDRVGRGASATHQGDGRAGRRREEGGVEAFEGEPSELDATTRRQNGETRWRSLSQPVPDRPAPGPGRGGVGAGSDAGLPHRGRRSSRSCSSPRTSTAGRTRRIYRTILEMYGARRDVDSITLTNALSNRGLLDRWAARRWCTRWPRPCPSAANARHYAQIVRDAATYRGADPGRHRDRRARLRAPGRAAARSSTRPSRSCSGSPTSASAGDFAAIKTLLNESFDRLAALAESGSDLTGVPTALRDLDRITAGFQDSNLVVLAARPGMGKTSLALNIAAHVGVREHVPVAIFSLEMSQEEVTQRLMCAEAKVDSKRLRTRLAGRRRLGQADQRLRQALAARRSTSTTPPG